MNEKYNHGECEKKWREQWESMNVYRLNTKSKKPTFSIDTPPPYVNADTLHAGHAMSYVQAEIIARFRRMQGYNVFYPMGFDDNGLPTERYVEKKFKMRKTDNTREVFIAKCKEVTTDGAKVYRDMWERLAIGVDWSLTYSTISDLSQRIAQRSFIELYRKELIYHKIAPAFWCPLCNTALAQADIDDLPPKSLDKNAKQRGVHERCKTPVEMRETMQWFISILPGMQEFLQRGDELQWFPEHMKERYIAWVSNLEWDWCISRDRFYGVPIPAWQCGDCSTIVLPNDKMLPVDPQKHTPAELKCSTCCSTNLLPEKQVLDTWMTSSLTPLINAKWGEIDQLSAIYPMSLRVQALEIIRTWLFYTVVKSHYHTQSLPWKTVMISGWGLDKNGKKMSKSEGNFVALTTLLDRFPADAIRWWATGASLGQDLRFNETEVKDGQKLVNKLWNAARFVDEILNRFEYSANDTSPIVNFADMWIMAELQETTHYCSEYLEKCDYNGARVMLDRFFRALFCDTYLELCKNRSWNPEKYEPNQIQSMTRTLSVVIHCSLRLFAPFLPYVTEEIYHNLFCKNDDKSIHLLNWPIAEENFVNHKMVKTTLELLTLVSKIRHFKGSILKSYRAPIARLLLITNNDTLAFAVKDLAGLANAVGFSVNNENYAGEYTEYITNNATIRLFA